MEGSGLGVSSLVEDCPEDGQRHDIVRIQLEHPASRQLGFDSEPLLQVEAGRRHVACRKIRMPRCPVREDVHGLAHVASAQEGLGQRREGEAIRVTLRPVE